MGISTIVFIAVKLSGRGLGVELVYSGFPGSGYCTVQVTGSVLTELILKSVGPGE